jgi:signal transduction histidine kinase
MLSMAERAKEIGATLDVQRASAGGTEITLRRPAVPGEQELPR